jgi:hypothetical protein
VCSSDLFQIEALEASLKTTYGLSGIFTNPATPATAGSYLATGNVTLYAQWVANNYAITYDTTNTTGGAMAQTFATAGSAVSLRTNAFTRTVYTFKNWNKYVDIENFPIRKWVHVVLMCEDNGMNVFVNGNIAKRLNFEKSVPYQNYQSIHVFSQRRKTVNGNLTQSLGGESYNVFGAITGSISLLTYYNYALSYTEINDILQAGPSKKVDPMSQDKPPYLTDDWWVTSQ